MSPISSLPDGFDVRDATQDDIGVAAEIIRAEERSVRGESIWSAADTSDFWRVANFEGGSWIVERDGDPVAFAACHDVDRECHCWVSVHPNAEGRGLGTWLLERVEQRARTLGAHRVRTGAFAENAAAPRLFERLGFLAARHFYRMRIALEHEPAPPEWPAGIEFAIFRPEDARAFHRALQEAFADEWGFHPFSFDEWRRTRLEATDTDVSLWFIARAGDEIAGVARCEAGRDGGGWVGALGVRKPWRRQGVGLALLRHAFREFHRRGEPHVGLGVDAENPAGATRLYERAGMCVMSEVVLYEKELG